MLCTGPERRVEDRKESTVTTTSSITPGIHVTPSTPRTPLERSAGPALDAIACILAVGGGVSVGLVIVAGKVKRSGLQLRNVTSSAA